MPRRCVTVDLPGGTARVQMNVPREKLCTYCGTLAGRLCDALLRSGPRAGKTCDTPMCAGCTSSPREGVDYCRYHVEAA